jgi:hypothetical protein
MLPSQGGDASSILVSRSTNMYHGIILDTEFKDPSFPEGFKVFAKKKSATNPWVLYGIEVPDRDIDRAVSAIQGQMKTNEPYYAHLYNDKKLIVIFKEKVFRVKPHISTWSPILEFGRKLNIPEDQLDFSPNRFQDEIRYFKQ